jgi:ketosteroid isomerase-like protein
MHVLRVWVRRPAGWRALLYQEVLQVTKSESPGPGAGNCENPCRSIPFTPQTANEKAAVASWQGVMRAMAANDAAAYSRLIADEFTATDTHHARPFTKAERLAQIEKMKQGGAHSAPPPLVSARMFDLGDTVLMIAREQRPRGKPYFNSRMWVKRDGRWQMLFSFNTRIEQ